LQNLNLKFVIRFSDTSNAVGCGIDAPVVTLVYEWLQEVQNLVKDNRCVVLCRPNIAFQLEYEHQRTRDMVS